LTPVPALHYYDVMQMRAQKIIRDARTRLQREFGSYYDQSSVAARLGVTQAYLSLIEGGARQLNTDLLVQLAGQLDIDLVELLDAFALDGGVIAFSAKGMSPDARRNVCALVASAAKAAA
jgi:transcriptional regulator with XRE-family HTH domain